MKKVIIALVAALTVSVSAQAAKSQLWFRFDETAGWARGATYESRDACERACDNIYNWAYACRCD